MSSATVALKVQRSEVVSLSEAGLSEIELENLIVEDPRILGLGEVLLIERQRRQEGAGGLDLLLEDREGESRFEVELKIGGLDESHLVRAIEYWDIERRRYHGYDHSAVLVAEDLYEPFFECYPALQRCYSDHRNPGKLPQSGGCHHSQLRQADR